MTVPTILYETCLKCVRHRSSGKVRDIYDVGDHHLLIVATDRISAFDVVLPDPISGKGRVLTSLSKFWFAKLKGVIASHLSAMSLEQAVPDEDERAQIEGRAMVVKKLKPLPVEAIVRGYLIGSGWREYQKTGAVCGIDLPQGLQQAEQLPEAIYTPSTKAEVGEHDENIPFESTVDLLGPDLAVKVRTASLRLYSEAAEFSRQRGIIIADTKFEFGLDDAGVLYLIDELLTPDSSRFWPAEQYRPGINPPSFDKQFVRDYLASLDWDKTYPGPKLPPEVIAKSAAKYREAEEHLLGRTSTV